MTFQVITGSGHCGTMWLAAVMDSIPGQSWAHEDRTRYTGLPWHVADTYSPDDRVFDSYWQSIRRRMLGYGVVGDANSWPPESLPAVCEVIPIDRVIYLTRDKERQAYSLLTKSPVWSNPPYPTVCHEKLRLYSRISCLPEDADLLVQANDFMPDWLRGRGLTVDVYGLEELTTDYYKFKELTGLTDGEFDLWRIRNINQKVFA